MSYLQIVGGAGGGVTSFSGDGTVITNSGSTGAVTATIGTVPPAKGGVATVTTAGQGYFFGGTVFDDRQAGAAAAIVASANQVRAFQFVLPFSITVGHVTWFVNSGAGDTVGFGIYSADGTTKIVDTGAVVSVGAGATQQVTITGVPLTPGVYYFAWTQTGTPTTALAVFSAAANSSVVLNANATKRSVTAGNTATAGALPSSLGTLTTAVSAVMPMTIFEP